METFVIPNLKYLFIVEYKDGAIYQQNETDISITDSKRSCFFDVRQDDVRKFFLVDANNVFCVDLEDGHFEINNVPFFMHDTGLELTDFRLIFYRQHEHKFNIGFDELSHEVKYCMGWQTAKEEKNHKRIIEFF